MGLHDITFNDELRLKRYNATTFHMRNFADDDYVALTLATVRPSHLILRLATSYLKTLADNAATVSLQSYTAGAYQTAAQLVAGRFDIPRCGDITPTTDITKQLGGPSNRWYNIHGISFQPASGDVLNYDTTNNRWLFQIGGSIRGYVDTTGFHDGAP